jgi:hypothetical protein
MLLEDGDETISSNFHLPATLYQGAEDEGQGEAVAARARGPIGAHMTS